MLLTPEKVIALEPCWADDEVCKYFGDSKSIELVYIMRDAHLTQADRVWLGFHILDESELVGLFRRVGVDWSIHPYSPSPLSVFVYCANHDDARQYTLLMDYLEELGYLETEEEYEARNR